MSQSSGMYTVRCPICNERYNRTNFMKRSEDKCPEVRTVQLPFGKRIRLDDTHLIACYRKHISE